ncbi:MAG: phosphatase PAP2 family protein [Alphaproteobacteria bacterium]|nr:phosphatase PAP2 family protein [Alphaproteobacteria bacterium]
MIGFLLRTVTDFGDSALTGTLSLLLAAHLLAAKERRAAAAAALAFTLTGGVVALGKLMIYSRCPGTALFLNLQSPSGHSAMSVAVYGTAAAIIASDLTGWRRALPFAVALPLVGLIAVSRVLVGAHTVVDVTVGTSIGALAGLGLWAVLLRGHAVHFRWQIFTIQAFVLLMLLHGLHFPAESMLRRFSILIRGLLPVC